MNHNMKSAFVFMALVALVLSTFGVNPAFADADTTRPVVSAGFAATSPAVGADTLTISGFAATDDVGVTGYMITTTSTEPLPLEEGWSSTPLDGVVNTWQLGLYDQGIYTLYPWVKDAAGNVSLFYYGDPGVHPLVQVTIDQAPYVNMGGDYYYQNAGCLVFRVNFSEEVTGFDATDITVTNGSYMADSLVDWGDGGYTFDVTPAAAGEVSASIPVGIATDATGNVTTTGASYTYYYDPVAPIVDTFTVEDTADASGDLTGAQVTVFSVTEGGSGLYLYQITGVPVGSEPVAPLASDPNWQWAGSISSPFEWTAPAGTNGDLTLYPWVMDYAGNVSAKYTASTETVTGLVNAGSGSGDVWSPVIYEISRYNPENAITNANSLTFLVDFNEDMKASTFTDGTVDFAVSGTATLGEVAFSAAVYDDGDEETGETNQWLITVSGGSLADANGTINLDIAATQNLQDLAGNPLTSYEWTQEEEYELDNVAPTVVSITRYNQNIDYVDFRIEASEALDLQSVQKKAVLFTTNLTGAYISDVECDSTYCYVRVWDGTGNGTIRLDIPAAGVTDPAGNNVANAPYTVGQAFTIAYGVAPTVPALLTPANNTLLDTFQPKLDWKDSVQNFAAAGTPRGYHYEINFVIVTPDGVSTWTENTASAFIEDEWFPIEDPLASLANSQFDFATDSEFVFPQSSTVTWKVRAYNSYGQHSAWSQSRTFRTRLAAPQLTFPMDGKVLDTTIPELSWAPVEGATSYTVSIMKAGKIAKVLTVKAPAYTATVLGLLPSTEYAWKVKSNGKNTGLYGEEYAFTTSTAAPLAPVMVSPAVNAMVPQSDAQILSWKTVGPGATTPPAHHYQVQVSVSKNFVQNAYYLPMVDDNVSDLIANATGIISTTFATEPGRTYYWRVRSWTADGIYGAWSATRSFKVKFETPVLLQPADGMEVDTLTPTLAWDISHGSIWTSYTVQIATDQNMTKGLKTYTLLPSQVDIDNPYAEFKVPAGTLQDGNEYYWRVKVNGAYIPATSVVENFKVNLP
jgi:hypothetical protein